MQALNLKQDNSVIMQGRENGGIYRHSTYEMDTFVHGDHTSYSSNSDVSWNESQLTEIIYTSVLSLTGNHIPYIKVEAGYLVPANIKNIKLKNKIK